MQQNKVQNHGQHDIKEKQKYTERTNIRCQFNDIFLQIQFPA